METNKKKDRIKDIAIIFLIVMLLLTLFSNTIMNRSLVEVNTARIESATLVSKVRGSGYVESAEAYNVTIKEVRKIATVEVHTGDTVKTGDVLFKLADEESDELIAKRTEVAKAENAYELAVLKAGISLEQKNKIEAGKFGTLAEQIATRDALKKAVTDAQAKVDKLTESEAASSSVDTSNEVKKLNEAKQEALKYQQTVDDAQAAYDEAKKAASDAYDYWTTLKGYQDGTVTPPASFTKTGSDLDDAVDEAKDAYDAATTNVTTKNTALTKAKQELVPYDQAVSTANTALSNKLSATPSGKSDALKKAETELATAKEKLDSFLSDYEQGLTLNEQYTALKSAKAELAKMEKSAVGATITSPINGTVNEIILTAGMKTEVDGTLMTIQPENLGYTLSFTTTAVQAQKIKVGDEAKVVNNWWGDDIKARVKQIKKSANDRNNVTVVCEITGDDARVGSNYTLSIGEKSASYDLVVPTSSIREDSNGRYILWIESKNTPLGNRYYARRADVEVIASDDTNSAINAQVNAYEYVITTTTKPVEPNQQVRLAD